MAEQSVPYHFRVAETGKKYALNGDLERALGCYRLAMRLTINNKGPELFFRHYLECLVEGLELNGDFDEVLVFCDHLEQLHDQLDNAGQLQRLDRATNHQRRGIVYLKSGQTSLAEVALQQAVSMAGNNLPLAASLLRWLQSRLTISPERIAQEQSKHRYFSVRKETLRPDLAVSITDDQIFGPGQSLTPK